MQVSYKRDLNYNYMILRMTEQINQESYPIRLLTGNHVMGLLQCMAQTVDNQVSFYYEITGKQSLANLYENQKMKREDLQLLFACLIKMLEGMRSYLLDAGNLILNPEYIYFDVSRKEISFCYFPEKQKEVTTSLQELAEYLLPKIDHMDQEAVILGYNIYRCIMEEGVCLEQIKKELYRDNTVEAKRDSTELWEVNDMEIEDSTEELLQTLLADETAAVHPAISTIIIAISGILLFIYFYFMNNTEFSWHIYVAAAVILLVIAGISAGLYLYKMRSSDKVKITKVKEQTSEETEDITAVDADIEQEWLTKENEIVTVDSSSGDETIILKAPGIDKMPCLVGVHPPLLQPILVKKDIFILGKLETAVDAVLPSFAISRIHAKITKEDGYWLSDLNSRNGTYVNHELLDSEEKHRLSDGDEITIGDLTYCFKSNGDFDK